MLFKIAAIFVSAAAVAAASIASNVCNIGVLQCCESIHPPQSAAVQSELQLLNLATDYTGAGFVGLQCVPVTGPTGPGVRSKCNNNLACCEKSEKNGVVAVGCTPVNVPV